MRIPSERVPTHSGEMLLKEFLQPLGMAQRELSAAINMPYQRVLSVPARHVQWSPGGVPDERIDLDIPHAALGGIEWRP